MDTYTVEQEIERKTIEEIMEAIKNGRMIEHLSYKAKRFNEWKVLVWNDSETRSKNTTWKIKTAGLYSK